MQHLQHGNLLRDMLLAGVVMRATKLGNLQRNNVARQVARTLQGKLAFNTYRQHSFTVVVSPNLNPELLMILKPFGCTQMQN